MAETFCNGIYGVCCISWSIFCIRSALSLLMSHKFKYHAAVNRICIRKIKLRIVTSIGGCYKLGHVSKKKRDRRAVQGKNGQKPLASGEKDTFFFYSRCHIEERSEKKLCLTARCILNTRACYSVTITENKKPYFVSEANIRETKNQQKNGEPFCHCYLFVAFLLLSSHCKLNKKTK